MMPQEEQIVRHIHENEDSRPDSLEIGSASKGGVIKIYFNADDLDKARELVDHAFVIKGYALSKFMAAQEAK